MLEVKAKKSKIWMNRIIECRNSGLSDRQWCRNNEIIPSSFYYWVKRLRIEKEQMQRDIIHADETVLPVLHEFDKKATTNSYMWLYRSGMDEKAPIVLFDYKPSRSGKNAAEYLKEFAGYLITDGYAGYKKVEGIIRCGCWSHLRRYFVEAMPVGANKTIIVSNGEIRRDYCNKLFAIENELTNLKPEERKNQRLELEKPVLEALWCWLETLNPLKRSRLPDTHYKNCPEDLDDLMP